MAFICTRENHVNFAWGRGILVNRKIWRNKLADDQEIDMLTKNKGSSYMFGYRSFKPSNAILIALIPWCQIIVVPLPENWVIFSMFSGGIILIFFFQISRIFLIILRCSRVNLFDNVYVKILLLTLIKIFSRTCDFCLIIADRPVSQKRSMGLIINYQY